ncbi:DUF4192 domain-containing protein [Actinomadura sp. HBU206391]|uniref:DUF4192 domain-containing protein n=1 Tax=Actinomadura sp. HBU206391 TaxID=2731692 RepID=UPI00164F9A82|nr:DUF4192 domain-containing protein [Actinomadura sp. HBU206391]MBC6461978.1 DUF4192 domain-containing protein [Actinomadura sp. HBU206391]
MTNDTHGDDRSPMVISTPQDLISAVPYLLGFHPQNSFVAVGSGGPHGTCAMRVDLPLAERAPWAPLDSTDGSWCGAGETDAGARAGVGEAEAIGERVAETLARNGFPLALLVGYGPAGRVTPLIDATIPALAESGVRVREALRVEDDRFWSYLCTDPACCPAEGNRFDITTSSIAAQAILDGQVALSGRAELARTVAPLDGAVRASMRKATRCAEERLFGWVEEALDPAVVRARIIGDGLGFVRRLMDRVGSEGTMPTDDEIAWLGVVLTHLRVRDEAWVRVDLDRLDRHVEFWRAVLCRVEQPYAAAPACLLAYAAFSRGDGGLANVALDRAFDADPDYSMAGLLRDLISAGLPPSEARLRMTPAELAEAYGEHADSEQEKEAS